MYQDLQDSKIMQSCPDCGVTICNCNNCHTMHCDSETLCSYLRTVAKMGMKNLKDPILSSSVLSEYTTNVSVYTSKLDERFDIKPVTSLDNMSD